LTSVELDELKLGDDQATDLKKRITRAKEGFREFAGSQQLVTAGSKWLQFGATVTE
jgi:hypothetical protein